MIELRHLTRQFGNRLVVDHVSLKVEKGDIFALIGPNGAGKSTTLKMLATLLRPTEGDASVSGYSIKRDGDKIRPIIGYTPEDGRAYPEMTVREYLEYFAAAFRILAAHGADFPFARLAADPIIARSARLVTKSLRAMTVTSMSRVAARKIGRSRRSWRPTPRRRPST